MPSTPEEDEGGRLWRRKARSLDLGGSSSDRSKAAAWMWHMHMSTTVKNESLVQCSQRQAIDAWESKRRSSSSSDRKDSRFRQEAANVSSPSLIKGASQPSNTVWDCGSKLYDTFELVSFSNRLDRSLLGVLAFDAPNCHHTQSPLHHAGVLRTLSLPRTLSLHSSASAKPHQNNFEIAASYGNPSVHESMDATTNQYAPRSDAQGLVAATKSKSLCASHTFAKWLAKFVKKLVSFHGCFKPILESIVEPSAIVLNGDEGGGMSEAQEQREQERYRVYEEKVKEGHKHFHHHHHHYHHHFLRHLDQSTRDAEPCNYKLPSTMSPLHASASARLSFDTMSKICTDKNWL